MTNLKKGGGVSSPSSSEFVQPTDSLGDGREVIRSARTNQRLELYQRIRIQSRQKRCMFCGRIKEERPWDIHLARSLIRKGIKKCDIAEYFGILPLTLSNRLQGAEQQVKLIREKVCPICGKLMVLTKGRTYCSHKCSATAMRSQTNEKYELILNQVTSLRREGVRWREIGRILDLGKGLVNVRHRWYNFRKFRSS